jgi:prophage regulatory protein
MDTPNLIRLERVRAKTGKSRSQIYADPTFPKSVPIGPRAVAWVEAEVDAWIAGQIARRNEKIAQAA